MIGMSEKRGGRARRAANPGDGVFARREAGEASGARACRPPRAVVFGVCPGHDDEEFGRNTEGGGTWEEAAWVQGA